jgi:hypothetical protein
MFQLTLMAPGTAANGIARCAADPPGWPKRREAIDAQCACHASTIRRCPALNQRVLTADEPFTTLRPTSPASAAA